ncbi:MAG: trigger factor, partial [Thermodesulfobacteriota bacterium]|nr:trigger factor [Thermodesulfobacteriota bacterium]
MKVHVEDLSTVKKILHIEIPEEDVTREVEKAYGTLKNRASIKGFRPGKIPRAILERRFANEVHADVSGQLIQSSYGEALRETALVPLGEPSIDQQDLEKGHPYHYSVTVEVCPFIEDLNLHGLTFKQRVHTVTDEEIQTQLKILQKQNAELHTVEEKRAVRDGDVVIIDYEGFQDGKPLEAAGKTENFQVEVGSGRILADFDQKLVGMEPNGTREFDLSFPEDYYNKDLAGLEVGFKVSLKEIKEEILPTMDDTFAKSVGEYETLEALKETIKKGLERRYEMQSERQLREDLIDVLVAQSDFELPEALVEEELSALVVDAQNAMAQRGMSLEESGQTLEGLSARFQPLAERKVREYLLLQKVIEQEGITVTAELVDKGYAELSEAMGQPIDTIKQFHDSYRESYKVFEQKILEKEAVRHITDVASQDPEMTKLAESVGAKGVNISGMCCTANEVLMRHGIPI